MMGQQQPVTATGGALRRMILLLAVAAVMAVMVAMASPAFAKGPSGETCSKIIRSAVERGHGGFPPSCRA